MDDLAVSEAAATGFDEADLEAIRESIASVLAERCTSAALHAFVDEEPRLAAALETEGRDLGWPAIGLPEAQGGFGLGARGVRLLHRELGRVVAPGGFLAGGVTAQVLAEHADADVAESWLARLLSGDVGAAIPAAIEARARDASDGDGGRKRLTLLGPPDAAVALIPVDDGLGLVDLAGRDRTPLDLWDRTRSLFEVELDPAEPIARLGHDARRTLVRTFAIAVASDDVGLARGIVDKTIAYMKERVQFGRPIGSFQALKHRAVDLVARIGAAEHLLDQAVEAADAGDEIADMWALLAKAAASEAAVFVAGDCVQLHGGVGFTWEFDVHLYLKRARLNEALVAGSARLRDLAAGQLARITRARASALELVAP